MPASDPNLTDLAAAVADGATLDWIEIERDAPDDRTRALVARLRAISDIARLHGTLDAGTGDVRIARASGAADAPAAWGPLRIVEKIGSGRFGDVYRAFDPGLDRDVALKLIREPAVSAADDGHETSAALVIEEGRLAARVRHPNVVTIYGAQRIDGRTGLWMELVHGRTLEAELQERGPFPAHEVAAIGRELCLALAAVHDAGLVHRDVKTTNVMRETGGRIVLGDFGTGQELDDPETERVGLAGTPSFLAPEIFDHRPATPRSDLYSLGVVLFRLAANRHPVEGRSLADIRQAHAAGRRVPLRALRSDLPRSLAGAIDRALASDPARRFADARAMAATLAPPARRVRGVTAASVAGVVGAAALAGWLWQGHRAGSPEPTGGSGVSAPAALSPVPSQSPVTPEAGAPPPASDKSASRVEPAKAVSAPRRAGVGSGGGIAFEEVNQELQRRANLLTPVGDGRRVTCRPFGTNAVAICDLVASTVVIVRSATTTGRAAGNAQISPAHSLIVYQWVEGGRWSLRVSRLDGSEDREVFVAPTARGFGFTGWAPDSRALFVELAEQPGLRHQRVPIAGGAADDILRSDSDGAFSPDRKSFVVPRVVDGQRDLVVIDVATGHESIVAPHPADDTSPVWTPDGKALLFVSDREGDRGLFLAPVAGGKARLIHQLGRMEISPRGFVSDGTALVQTRSPWDEAFTASVDLIQRVVGTPARLNLPSMDIHTAAHWNADGSSLAYVAGGFGAGSDARTRLVVRHRQSGLREFPIGAILTRGDRAKWLPDGRHVAVSYYSGSAGVVDLIDVESGEKRRVLSGVGTTIATDRRTPDVYYLQGNPTRISRIDTVWLETTALYDARRQGELRSGAFAVSPDGQQFVVVATPPSGPGGVLRIVRRDGSVVDRQRIGADCPGLAWSPDASLLLAACASTPNDPVTLWIVPVDAGSPTRIALDVPRITDLSVRPDGRELAFTAGNPPPKFYLLRGIR